MVTKIYGGTVITDRKSEKKDIYIEDGKIIAVTKELMPYDNLIDAREKYVSAGFIDIHTHGAAGFDFLDNDEEGYIKIAIAHAQHGAGTIIPTITSAEKKSTLEKCINVRRLQTENHRDILYKNILIDLNSFISPHKYYIDKNYICQYPKQKSLE